MCIRDRCYRDTAGSSLRVESSENYYYYYVDYLFGFEYEIGTDGLK